MRRSITRRQFFKLSTAGSLALTGAGATRLARAVTTRTAIDQRPKASGYQAYFGDLHNHNAVGYARGSLRRTFEIARNHLDFFAFTPHGYWHDIGHYEGGIEQRWLTGFEVTRKRWPEVLAMVREFDQPGTFVPIAGYEWHSSSIGDYHIIFPDLDGEYVRFDDIRTFQQFARERGAIMIPHHPANRRGDRGANPAYFDPKVTPVIEIFSEWGNAEHDRAPYPYIRHSHGGRWTRNTYQHFLAEGHRLGVVASTDDHLGYPGAYREGLAAVLATELTREGIFDALRSRRTYGVTGDRIQMDFRLNGHAHVYVRTQPLLPDGTVNHESGVVHIVNGCGGASWKSPQPVVNKTAFTPDTTSFAVITFITIEGETALVQTVDARPGRNLAVIDEWVRQNNPAGSP